jgi:hypothetical protein
MLFLNSIELTVHEINVHVDKLCQCQSCYKILRNTDEFNEHIKSPQQIRSIFTFLS